MMTVETGILLLFRTVPMWNCNIELFTIKLSSVVLFLTVSMDMLWLCFETSINKRVPALCGNTFVALFDGR